jgi:hypothetical protein
MCEIKSLKDSFLKKLRINTAITEKDYARVVELLEIFEKEVFPKEEWIDFIYEEHTEYSSFWFGIQNKLYIHRLEWFEHLYSLYLEAKENPPLLEEESKNKKKKTKRKKNEPK